ncbi:MAG: phospholipase D-like domain-containing protein [Planctomycetota bacterium]
MVLMTAVHPGGARDWEHVRVENSGDGPADLSGWTLDDGEGTWTLPTGTRAGPGEGLWMGINDSAFQILWGRSLDIVVARTGNFCLADRGDELVLRDPAGRAIDCLVYGASKGSATEGWSGEPIATPSSMPWGRLLLRNKLLNTDTATDWWDWREPRCGWSTGTLDRAPIWGNASCFVTPGDGWKALTGAIASARTDLAIALYDLTNLDLATAVARRAREGVRTRLLVESAPVGMTEDERGWRTSILVALQESGVEVWETRPTVKGASHRPYRYHHEKYCVIDGSYVVVTTENWCTSSFPARPRDGFGSRGWGAVVESEELAEELLEVFDFDLDMSAMAFSLDPTAPVDLPALIGPGPPGPAPQPCEVRLLVGPEDWGPDLGQLLSVLDGARESILLELAYLDVWWGNTVSPLVEALLKASIRGVEVRMVLDPGLKGEGRASLEDLHVLASRREVRGLRGVLAQDLPDATRVHAKGAIIDGDTVLLGSLNWAWSSVARNREVVLVLEGGQVVQVLTDAFEKDWTASVTGMEPTPPRCLIMEVVSGWEGHSFPRYTLQPFGDDVGSPREPSPEKELSWYSLVKVAITLALFMTAWAVERRYAIRGRWATWLEDRLDRLGKELLTPSPRPSSGEGAPGGPLTTSPGRDPGKGPPPDPPPDPSPDPPPRRYPLVVVLEEEVP